MNAGALGGAALAGGHDTAERGRDIFLIPPLPWSTSPCKSDSSRVRARVRRMQRTHELATSAIYALNSFYAAPTGSGRGRFLGHAPCSSRIAEVCKYIFDCCYDFAVTPLFSDEYASHLLSED